PAVAVASEDVADHDRGAPDKAPGRPANGRRGHVQTRDEGHSARRATDAPHQAEQPEPTARLLDRPGSPPSGPGDPLECEGHEHAKSTDDVEKERDRVVRHVCSPLWPGRSVRPTVQVWPDSLSM